MNKQEFEKKVNENITDNQFKIIEKVYTYHPSINEVNGKEQIEILYKNFGIDIFYDMINTANKIEYLEEQENIRKLELEKIKTIKKYWFEFELKDIKDEIKNI